MLIIPIPILPIPSLLFPILIPMGLKLSPSSTNKYITGTLNKGQMEEKG
jgi:hypothetical protein